MKQKDWTLLALLFSVFAHLLLSFQYYIPLDQLMGGTDTASHLFKTWYVTENGLSYWSSEWYAGFPFISHYSPFFYLFSGFAGKIIGVLTSYKISINLFFMLLPIAFYSMLKEFKIGEKERGISVLIFSLSPVYIYYLFDGRHPSIVGFFFGILFWKYMMSYINSGDKKNFWASAFYLLFSILSHHLTAFLIFASSVSYFALNKHNFLRALKIGMTSFIISLPWSVPFLLGGLVRNASRIISPRLEVEFAAQVISSFYVQAYSHQFTNVFIILVGVVLTYFMAIHLTKGLDKMFIVFTTLIVLIGIISYNRAFIVLPIPISIIASQGMSKIRNKIFNKILYPSLIILLLGSFYMIPETFSPPENIPEIPNNTRAIFLPMAPFPENNNVSLLYESYLIPRNGAYYILGWHPESQSAEKSLYNSMISSYKSYTPEEYYNILSDGNVEYIVSNKTVFEYFNTSSKYNLVEKTEEFYLIEIVPKPSYAILNGNPINTQRIGDTITSTFICEDGILTIKESFHPSWKAKINDKNIPIQKSEFGFMNIEIDIPQGECLLEIKYFLF